MAMPKYEIRDIPNGLWKRVTDRANDDGYPLHVLILQLLEDYAIGRVRPGGAPPPLQTYAFLKEPFRKMLIAHPERINHPVRERWEWLRAIVEEDGHSDSPLLAIMDQAEPTHRAAILTWLERLTVKQVSTGRQPD